MKQEFYLEIFNKIYKSMKDHHIGKETENLVTQYYNAQAFIPTARLPEELGSSTKSEVVALR